MTGKNRKFCYENHNLMSVKSRKQTLKTQGFDHFEAKFLYFPIPQAEVDANLNLEQKPEWR